MPGSSEIFQQIAPPSQGPFSNYLQPPTPAIDNPMNPPTGWEPRGAAYGDLALGFLKGVRQNRLAQAAQQDRNVQTQLDNYRSQVNALLQDPDLTEEGRRNILSQANTVMNQHMQYELRDAPKEGVAGFFKNLLVHASGGPIKTREPINFNEETGKLMSAAKGFSQKAIFQSAIQDATSALNTLKQQNPAPTVEQVQQAIAPAFAKVAQGAQGYTQAFAQTMGVPMGVSYPAEGSPTALLAQANRMVPGATPPPGIPEQGGELGGRLAAAPPQGQFGAPMSRFEQYATQPPPGAPQPAAVPPAPQSQPEGTAGIYTPGYGPELRSHLDALARVPGGMTSEGQPRNVVGRTSGHPYYAVNINSGVQGASGEWDVTTNQRIGEPVTQIAGSLYQSVAPDAEGWAQQRNRVTGRVEYATRPTPDGRGTERYRVQRQAVQVFDPETGQVTLEYPAVSDYQGKQPGQVAKDLMAQMKERRSAESKLDDWKRNSIKQANDRYNSIKDQVIGKNIDIALQGLAGLGIAVDPKVAEQSATNSKPLLDLIEQQRKQALQDINDGYAEESSTIANRYGARTAAPPGAPAASPGAATPAPPGAARVPVPASKDIPNWLK